MGTLAATYQPTRRGLPAIVWLVVVLVALVAYAFAAPRIENASIDGAYLASVTVDRSESHAYTRHKADAIAAWRCFDEIGHSFMVFNWWRNNYIKVCQDETGQVYFQVLRRIHGKVRESTAYKKDDVFDLEIAAKILIDQNVEVRWVKAGVKALEWLAEMIVR